MATKINTPILYGENATLSATTDVIAPYKYQWKRNGENLRNGNNKSYTTPPLKPEDFKAKYSVQIFGQDKIESSDEVVINDAVQHLDPITNRTIGAKTGFMGVKVVKPFSTKPIPPYQAAPAKPLGKPLGGK
jgi:hypothetical protein